MKQFISIVFGGLLVIGLGVGIAYGGHVAWQALSLHMANVRVPSLAEVASAISRDPTSQTDGTAISGLTRRVTFTASEEEDVLNASMLSLPPGAARNITATAYAVRDLTKGDSVVVGHNADKLLPIASLTKLVTAVVAGRLIDPSAKITLTSAILATYGNTPGFRVGETYTAGDLFYPLLMVSSNDTAEAFAQYYGRPAFIQAMNDFVQSIGAYRTSFNDPSGLSPLNVSTANDLALIIDWIRKNDPNIIAITELKTKTIRAETWVNPTHFLSWSNYIGGKNGYTDEANRTGIGLFILGAGKDIYAVVVLGSASRDTDMIKLIDKVR